MEGVKPWAIDITDALPKQIPKWCFGSTYSSSKSGDYTRVAVVNINMTDGKYEMSYGFSQP